jgi:low affinity Fe/Cu permease
MPESGPKMDLSCQKNNSHHKKDFFCTFATQTARVSGTPLTFFLAVGTIFVWAITGPVFQYSDTWQLVINTGTTIITFLMVFLIQNTQNRDSEALHLKIDELIRATKGAQNAMINLEDLSQEELDAFKAQNRDANAAHDMLERALQETIHMDDEQTREWARKSKKVSGG